MRRIYNKKIVEIWMKIGMILKYLNWEVMYLSIKQLFWQLIIKWTEQNHRKLI